MSTDPNDFRRPTFNAPQFERSWPGQREQVLLPVERPRVVELAPPVDPNIRRGPTFAGLEMSPWLGRVRPPGALADDGDDLVDHDDDDDDVFVPKYVAGDDEDEEEEIVVEPRIAVVSIVGPLEQHVSWSGDSYQSVRERFELALAGDSHAILLKIDSPGGDTAGMVETARAMVAAKERSRKVVYAFADEAAYAGAYAIACVADKIFLPDSGGVGSVGVLSVVADMTAAARKAGINAQVVRSGTRKADGHPLLALDEATISRAKQRCNELAGILARFVAEQRDMSSKRVLGFEGACFYGQDAVSKGLADGVASLDEALRLLSRAVTGGGDEEDDDEEER